MRLGAGELLIILFIILFLFGAKRLPGLAKSLGLAIKEFKNAGRDVATTSKASDVELF